MVVRGIHIIVPKVDLVESKNRNDCESVPKAELENTLQLQVLII